MNRLLTTYKADLAQGQPASALRSIAHQITADAKILGQSVTLPTGGSTAPASAATDAGGPEPSATKLNKLV